MLRLGPDRWALPLPCVDEVGRVPGLTRVPGLPAFVAGVANWRGRVLAVLDLRPLLGVVPEPLGRTARVVVVRASGADGEVRVGLLADAVDGTLVAGPDAVEQPLASLPPEVLALASGQVTTPEGPLGLLSVPAVLGLSARLQRVRSGA